MYLLFLRVRGQPRAGEAPAAPDRSLVHFQGLRNLCLAQAAKVLEFDDRPGVAGLLVQAVEGVVQLQDVDVVTPLEKTQTKQLASRVVAVPVQRTGLGLQPTQKSRETLFAQIRCQAIRIGLIRETAELNGPHAGRRYGLYQFRVAGGLRLTFYGPCRRTLVSDQQVFLHVSHSGLVVGAVGVNRYRDGFGPVTLENDRLSLSRLTILTGQRDRFGDDLGFCRWTIEEHRDDHNCENHEHDCTDNAFL